MIPLNGYHAKTALVTGGCGFIGSHLCEALAAAGARVVALDNLQAGKWSNLEGAGPQVTLVEGDVRDKTAVSEIIREASPDFVFHLAANASVPASVEDPKYDFESNCVGTFVVLEALRSLGSTARMVLASSAAVYGQPTEFPISELTALHPISPYGASKLAAEVECRVWHEAFGTSVCIARLFNSYGPRMPRFVIIDFLRKLERNPQRLEILGNGKQVRDFTYVSDTVAGLMTIALNGVSGESYNVASGSSHSVTELAETLLGILGLTHQTMLEYTGASWIGDAQHWEVRVDKLREIGYEPRIDLATGLRDVASWFEAQQQ